MVCAETCVYIVFNIHVCVCGKQLRIDTLNSRLYNQKRRKRKVIIMIIIGIAVNKLEEIFGFFQLNFAFFFKKKDVLFINSNDHTILNDIR